MPSRRQHRSSPVSFGPASLVLLIALLTSAVTNAQTGQTGAPGSPAEDGRSWGGYTVHQSMELGYRFNQLDGSGNMYNTLVNLYGGPRLLDQTLSMQSQTHQGMLFDNLFITSFGWGGDPQNAMRVRIDKIHWYDFRAAFRRDQNYFDYDLLANPLNPSTSSPSVTVVDSPHSFAATRRMSDFDLTILPQSKLSFRLGYSRNNMTGPTYSSVHEGTDAALYQPWNTTLNSYRFGVDWNLLERTTLSYDQFLDYYKGDTNVQLSPFVSALLPDGTPVSLGLPFNTVANQPCAVVPPATSLIDPNGALTNLGCNGYISYSRTQRIRTSAPTERISLRSGYFQRLELTASYAYSSADMTTPFNESFDGLVSRTKVRQFVITGPAVATRTSNVVDLGATLHLTNSLRLVDTFTYWSYRIPESFNPTEIDQSCSGTCTLVTTPDTTTTTTTLDETSFNQKWGRNTVELVWDLSKKFGARVGYRYGEQQFNHFVDFTTGDVDHIIVIQNAFLFGMWARPVSALRVNFDLEHAVNNSFIVRMAPLSESRYRAQVSYTPRPWAVFSGSLNWLEQSNSTAGVDYRGHNRNYGFTASLSPRDRYGFEVAYNFNDFLQNSLICFNDTPPAGVTLPVVTNAGSCVDIDPNNPLLTDGYYTNNTQFVMAAVRIQPAKRVEMRLGYSIDHVTGTTPQFNILQPLGSLDYNYQFPSGGITLDLGHNLSGIFGWNYYQYAEGSFVGPTDPRYFHANNFNLSMRWAF